MNQQLEDVLVGLLPSLEKLLEELRHKQRIRLEKESSEAEQTKVARELRKKQEANKKSSQDNCPHIAGCSELSRRSDVAGRSSIVWHTLDTGVTVGICTVCQRELVPEDEDYVKWRKVPSFCKSSAAGQRWWLSSNISATKPLKDYSATDYKGQSSYTQDELYSLLEQERETAGFFAYSAEGLDALPDADIKKLFEGVKEYRKALRNPEDALEKIYSGPEWSVGK